MPKVDRGSFTALFMEIAALRALEHYSCEELFSERYIRIADFICKWAIAATLNGNPQVGLFQLPYAEQSTLARQMIGIPLDEHSLGRKAFIVELIRNAIEQERFEQVVVIGGGNDPRLLEESIHYQQRYPNVHFFELDKGETFTIKNKAIKTFQRLEGFSIPKNFYAVECNLMNQDLFSVLPSNFDGNKKTLFIAEGVTTYLSESVVANIFKKIKLLGDQHQFLVSFTPGKFAVSKVEAQAMKHAGEVHQYHLNRDDMIPYFNALGFTLKAQVTHMELHKTMASLTHATVQKPPQNKKENYVLLTTEYTSPQENNINSIPVLEELNALLKLQVNPHYNTSVAAAI